MTEPNQKITASELCSITIMFPVQNDVEALELRRKIKTVLSDVEGVRIDFHLTNITKPPMSG